MAKHKPLRSLPVQQLLVLSIARFAEPIAMTSVFPYLPEMIESLSVPPDQVAKYAGIAASVFSLSQAVFAVPWGRLSDRYGRKPAILTCLTGTMLMTVLWGFSTTLWMAVLARALQGVFNGNVGIIRTTVAEMVPWKELQPRAFSVMPLVWNIGSIFGPMLGGALSNPLHIKPGHVPGPGVNLLERFPYVLPNIVSAVLFLIGITTGILFLDESLETRKGKRDIGREAGKRLTYVVKKAIRKVQRVIRPHEPENEPLLAPPNLHTNPHDEEATPTKEPKGPAQPPPAMKECLTKQSMLNLLCYTLLAMHNLSFDQLIPIYMHYPEQDHSPSNPAFNPPFKFSGGFGLDSQRIGLLFTLYGVSGMIIQFFIFPPVANKLGIVKCLRICSIALPIIYFCIPFTSLLPDQTSKQVAGFALMLCKGFFSTFAFPCSTILLTNSASSLRILGTLNGIAVSVSAIGRAAGPAIEGAVFTIGVQRGYIIAPWWLMSAIAWLAAVPVFFIVEGAGFGGSNDDEVEDSDDEGDDDEEGAEGPSLNRAGMVQTATESGAEVEEVASEHGYGSIVPLSRTNTVASNPFSDVGEEGGPADATVSTPSRRPIRRESSARKVSRRVSIPIGMGGMSRRYSSNLGHSLGSAGGYT
ncbi:hypothetical protein MBLNU457_3091t1 [Dothideomycetes sp. NU457]